MKSYEEALQIIKDEISTLQLQTEVVRIEESLNRILSEDIISDVDLPPFDNSAMDGYAVKYSDRRFWNVIGEVKAGNFKHVNLGESDAVLITTGGKIPSDADTVIPLEDIIENDNQIWLNDNAVIKKGMNIRLRGNDLEKGKVAINRFAKITPKSAAVLASCGRAKIKMFSKLRIGILVTGDELVPIDEFPTEDKIRISNSYGLSFAVNELHHTPVNYGMAKDEADVIKKQLQKMISDDNEIIIITGSVSVGKYDLIKDIFKEIGVEIKFWKANIKPGKPIVFGVCSSNGKKKIVFGLPGNPVSCLVNFHIFIKPAINYLLHQTGIDYFFAELEDDIMKNDSKRHFSRGVMFYEGEKLKVKSLSSQSSGSLVEMSRANCLIEIPENTINPQKGSKLKCIKI